MKGVFAGAMLFAAAMGSARADYASTVLSHGPVAYWRLDETNASPPLNLITNATALGSVANGNCVADATKGVGGIVGSAIQFHNPGNIVGHCGSKVDVPWNAAISPRPPFSIEFWANPTSLGTDATGFCPLSNTDPNEAAGSRAGWVFYLNNAGRWQFRLGNRSASFAMISGTNGNATPGTWQHIVATWDGTNANLYANGVLIGGGTASITNWVNNPQSPLRFGGNHLSGNGAVYPFISTSTTAGARGFDGLLDEVAIYTNLLSASKISAHYSAASTNNAGYHAQILADSPVAYWEMEDAVVVTPSAGVLPIANNIGSLGSAANGTNEWGTLAAQPGSGFAGFGPTNMAVTMDGDNGYFEAMDAPGLHFTNQITMLAWIKPNQQDFFRNIIAHSKYTPATPAYEETFLRISRGPGSDGSGDGNYYEVGSSDGTQFYDSVLFPIPSGDTGNWVFLAGTFDGANWKLYRNGQLVGTLATANGGAHDVAGPWTVGSRQPDAYFVGQEESFGGALDEPAIFTNALSGSDILALYYAAQVPPIFTRLLQNPGTVPAGSNVNFSVWAEGNPILGYLWSSNGISTGVTATNYSISNIQAGTYTVAVVVTNTYGTNSSSVTFNGVNIPPSISAQPISTTRIAGFPFNFSVTASGTPPLTYYWMLGNSVVQTGAASNHSATASLANGGSYTVVVSNVTGLNVTSAPAVLTVNPVPGAYGGAVVASEPMTFWRLDETNGSIAHDQIGGNDGTYFNARLGQLPGYSPLDPNEPAVAFSGLNSYVGKISGTAINFTGHTDFTLEAWVKAPAGLADDSTIIAKGTGFDPAPHSEQFSLDVYSGVYRFFVASTNPSIINAASAAEGPNGGWQHVVAVYDDQNTLGGGARSYVYVNGHLQGNGAVLASGLYGGVAGAPVSIGSKRGGSDPNYAATFNGLVSQVAVYGKALDASTILNHYAAAYGPITLTIQRLQAGTNIQLTWPAGSLQSASNVTGPYVTITNALSPFTTNSGGGSRFFRVKL